MQDQLSYVIEDQNMGPIKSMWPVKKCKTNKIMGPICFSILLHYHQKLSVPKREKSEKIVPHIDYFKNKRYGAHEKMQDQ